MSVRFLGNEFEYFVPKWYNLKLGGSNGIVSEETKRKIAEANTGRKATPETIERLRLSHLGYKVKESTKKKLSVINKGKVLSEEHKRKIADSNAGKKRTEQAKEKMRVKKLKYIYEVVSPDGKLAETQNLRQFCRDNGLNIGHMNSVACGNKKHYKQWQVIKQPLNLNNGVK